MFNKLFIIIMLSMYSYASLEQKITTITNTTDSSASIAIGNLKIGQSGIIVHDYNENQSIIVSSAVVVSSNNSTSQIKFIKFNDLSQNALPTAKLTPSNNDTFILNYLYKKSLLITPNGESNNEIKEMLPSQSFLNSDIFASYLKLEANPTPTKKDFIEFCRTHNLGTIYIVLNKKCYVLDAKSFMIIDTLSLSYSSEIEEKPFYTKVDEIKKDTFSWFQKESIGNYTQYYTSLIDSESKNMKEIVIIEESDKGFFNGNLKALGL